MIKEHMTIGDIESKLYKEQRLVYAEGFKPWIMIFVIFLLFFFFPAQLLIGMGLYFAVLAGIVALGFYLWRTLIFSKRLRLYLSGQYDRAIERIERELKSEEETNIRGTE